MSLCRKPKKPPPTKPKMLRVLYAKDINYKECDNCEARLESQLCDCCGHLNSWMNKGVKK